MRQRSTQLGALPPATQGTSAEFRAGEIFGYGEGLAESQTLAAKWKPFSLGVLAGAAITGLVVWIGILAATRR